MNHGDLGFCLNDNEDINEKHCVESAVNDMCNVSKDSLQWSIQFTTGEGVA